MAVGDPDIRYQKLRRGVQGANGLSKAQVVAHQRARLYEAMIEIAADRGYEATTVKAVCTLAGVSRRTFYDLFGANPATDGHAPKEACFLRAYDFVVGRAAERVNQAYRSCNDPEQCLCRAFEQFAREAAQAPETARMALVEVLGAGPAAVARMQRTRLLFEHMIATSYAAGPAGTTPPPPILKGVVCGVERVTRHLLLTGRIEELPSLADELSRWALSYRSAVGTVLDGDSARRMDTTPYSTLEPQRVQGERVRMLRCAAQIAACGGYARLTPAQIAHAAGVSEARFGELFASTEQCLLEALDRMGLETLVHVARAARGSDDRLVGLHRGMAALMNRLASDPVLVRVAFVEVFAVGPPGIERRERLLGQFTDLLTRSLPASAQSSNLAIEASVGAIWGIVHDLIARGGALQLPALTDYATYLALAPAVGADIAVQAICPPKSENTILK